MKKRILLIDPPFQKFMNFSKNGIPIGLLSLAGELKSKGNIVNVFDADYNPKGNPYPFIAKLNHYDEYLSGINNLDHVIWKDIESQIKFYNPEVVGISLISTKLKSGLIVAKIAKDLGVQRIIAGGPHVTIYPEDAFGEDSYIDSVVQGEGENVFEKALTEKIVKAERIKDIKKLAWPARESLINLKDYLPNDLGFVMSSRGCPGSCNFCCSESLWGRSIRFREIDDVLNEMDSIHENYGTQKFYLVDDTFTLNRKRVENFCEGIQKRNYKWSCLTRVDRLNENMLEKMSQSGCSMIKVGIESGSQKVLDLMNKEINLTQIKRAANLLNKFSMPWLAYIMVGVPDETSEDVDKTIQLIDEIRPSYVSAAIYTPYPGTKFSKENKVIDFAREEANHHSLKVLAGNVPREKIIDFMEFADKYNSNSKLAKIIYKC